MTEGNSELVIALVAAVGTDVGMVADEIASELSRYDFDSETFRLSVYLAEQGDSDFRDLPFDESLWEGMTQGDELRRRWERDDALALHAISDIVATRDQASEGKVEVAEGGDAELAGNLERFAFILRSLKTPDELQTLRTVYGPRLVVVGAYSPSDKRRKHLEDEIGASRKNSDQATWSHPPEELIERDESEGIIGGQALSDTFHRADFFIRAWTRDVVKTDLRRTLQIMFGDPFRTPTRDEFAQFQAAGAALRSAELGRQVGAAIAPEDGSVIAWGANEVPSYGGGSHWEVNDQLVAGNRDFEILGHDSNQKQFDALAERISDEVGATLSDLAVQVGDKHEGTQEALDELQSRVESRMKEDLRRGGLRDLTEFGRAVHAEMNALLDAARRGVSVAGATLYSTTFPCHNCARHIIGAGIVRVVFIEPYAKSKAGELHSDSIAIEVPSGDSAVQFEPFVGVAPRRYLEMFDAAARTRLGHLDRRAKDGSSQALAEKDALPVFRDAGALLQPALPAYRVKELLALDHYNRLTGDGSERSPGEGGGQVGEVSRDQGDGDMDTTKEAEKDG